VFDMAADPQSLRPVMGRIQYVRGDLGSPADLYRAMMLYRPEGVFHLGAVLAGPSEENPIAVFKSISGRRKYCWTRLWRSRLKNFSWVSSISVFGRDAVEPVRDDATKNPETIYGQTKLAAEHLLLWYARNMDSIRARFVLPGFSVLGALRGSPRFILP